MRRMASHLGARPPFLGVGTGAEIRAIEAELIEGWGLPAVVLMERAASAAAALIEHLAPGAPVALLVGTGNNGADGLALARILHDRQVPVRILAVGGSMGELASRQLGFLNRRGLSVRPFTGAESFGAEWVVVDAILGAGLSRPLKSDAMLAVDWLNRQRWRAVVALDLPTGLDPATGKSLGGLVQATDTIAMGALKPGLFADSALEAVGRLWFADVGLPRNLLEALPGRLIEAPELRLAPPDAHKGSQGAVLVVAGSRAMLGAGALAARGAARAGCGLVYWAVPYEAREAAAMAVPEAIAVGLPEGEEGVGPEALRVLGPYLARVKAVVAGSGLGRNPRVTALIRHLAEAYTGPLVLDADALPGPEDGLPARTGAVVLTPHPGELARMFATETVQVQADRVGHATALARRFSAIAVLKGARTIVAEPEGSYAVQPISTPLLATAGAGDVLAGLIGGLIGRGLEAEAAAEAAVWAHAMAAKGMEEGGMVSLVASDLLERLPLALGAAPPAAWRVGDLMRIA